MAKIKTIKIDSNETDLDDCEGIYLVDPKWLHLDDREVQEKLSRGERIFKIHVEGEF